MISYGGDKVEEESEAQTSIVIGTGSSNFRLVLHKLVYVNESLLNTYQMLRMTLKSLYKFGLQDSQCFFFYLSLRDVIFEEQGFHECYVNYLRTTIYSRVLGHSKIPFKFIFLDFQIQATEGIHAPSFSSTSGLFVLHAINTSCVPKTRHQQYK